MSERLNDPTGFPEAVRPGELPKIRKLTDFSAEALGELILYMNQNVQVPLNNIIGYKVEGRVYDRNATPVDVVNTTTETSIYSKVISGGDMTNEKALRLKIIGTYLHNNGALDNITYRVKFGGTTLWANLAGFGGVIGAARHEWVWTLELRNTGVANQQELEGNLRYEIANATAPTTGRGSIQFGSQVAEVEFGNEGAIDTSVAKTLDVTVQWAVASANNSFKKLHAILELV